MIEIILGCLLIACIVGIIIGNFLDYVPIGVFSLLALMVLLPTFMSVQYYKQVQKHKNGHYNHSITNIYCKSNNIVTKKGERIHVDSGGFTSGGQLVFGGGSFKMPDTKQQEDTITIEYNQNDTIKQKTYIWDEFEYKSSNKSYIDTYNDIIYLNNEHIKQIHDFKNQISQ